MEKIALSLVGSIASPIISKLENTAFSYFGGDITEDELQHLQNTILPKIKAVLRVAKAKNVEELEPWLVTLKEAAHEAEDVLDMYEYQRLKIQVSSFPNCIKILEKKARAVAAPFSLKTALRKSMEKLINVAARTDQFTPIISNNFPNQDPMNQQQQQQHAATVSSPTSLVIGRDHERESIVNMLISAANMPSTSSERRIPVLAIYGIGGAGKTTLAQSIYKDSRIEEHFDKNKMWVHVSRKFDPHEITKKIIEAIKLDECPHMENFDALQSVLKNMLKSKNFFLVLDDVWCLESLDKELWDRMLIPFNEVGEVGSRILITCRAEEVTLKLEVNHSFLLAELKDNDYWSIFMHYSFGDVKKDINDTKLLEVAREIVKNLSKSPLAARMVGSSLRGKQIEDWKQTLQRGDMLKDTLDALYWSFEQLPPYLQRCFALCSLYPKGYCFKNIEDFVRLWIAQGFVEVPSDSTVTIEDEAMRYFNELLSLSFFQQKYKWYEMHDLLHDLAEKVSKDYCFRIEDDRQRIPKNVMHLSIVGYKYISSHISDIFKLVNLRTLIIVSWTIEQDDIFGFIQQVFKKFKKLRMLHVGVGYHKAFKLDKSVGGLKLLRYFQMEEVEELPESLGKLYHLQFLVIQRSIIDKVPQNLNNLINLRYMGNLKPSPYYPDHDVTASKIPLFGKLISLQHIDHYKVSSRETKFGIGQLKNLQQLRGTLRLYNLENVKDKTEASEASLEKKKHIDTLKLQWKRLSKRDGSMDEEVLQGLQPPPNLGALEVNGYNGVRLPKWTRNDGSLLSDLYFIDLERLHSLEIVNCHNLVQVPSLPRMLRRLVIRGCANLSEVPLLPLGLEELDLEDCSGVVETMLSNMSLFNCENGSSSSSSQGVGFVLKRLRIVRCSIDGGGEKELCLDKLTSLTDLTFTELPWLISLLLGPNLTTSLRELSVMGCPKLTIKSGGDSVLSPSSSSSSLQTVTIDDLSLLTALPRREFLNSISSLTIQKSTQDEPFTAEQEELFQHLTSLTSLTSLTFDSCEDLPSLPANLENLSYLKSLYIWGCPKIESLSNLPASLSFLYIIHCPKIESLPNLPASLSYLRINQCPKIESLPNLPASLSSLTIWHCPKIESLPYLPASLSSLRISGCPKIESLPNLPASLREVEIAGCHPRLKQKYRNDKKIHFLKNEEFHYWYW